MGKSAIEGSGKIHDPGGPLTLFKWNMMMMILSCVPGDLVDALFLLHPYHQRGYENSSSPALYGRSSVFVILRVHPC
ncbi:hypothetical protein RchiOBHm_Chr2g0136721 [Rosa chinensis]|uniref:Uncharacterized protein n=1 Tax=Rosa chinensis TaxID=74649 RepID=A0A2P6RWD8_ROSCH|nr:hypothetical protein RchiOBHm_Chr2g0136721 [Rosa chinensis]